MTIGTNHPGLWLKNRKILVVAADAAKVSELREILMPAGYVLDAESSGEAALARFAQLEPDLILLDVGLPDPDVFAVCRALKRVPGGEGVPIIFITSQSDPQEVVEGLAAGGVDYLSQPFRKPEVLARIRVHLLNRLRLSQLRSDDKAKNRLLCMAAHDLRNPLVSIRALTSLLRSSKTEPVTAHQRDVLDTVYDASQSMLDLVNELLDVSVLEAGELNLTVSPTSLDDLITDSVKLCNATAAEKGSTIVWHPGRLSSTLALDKPKVRQVLNNLLGNAIKFSPPGSVISFETELTDSHCSIAVRDQGPGVLESERSRLFKDFSRTSVKATGGESSTGLGLSICYRIMQAHAGSIRTTNLPDGGAEFRISFPLPL